MACAAFLGLVSFLTLLGRFSVIVGILGSHTMMGALQVKLRLSRAVKILSLSTLEALRCRTL